jgi:ATP-dependent DNA helicase RecQ
MPVPDLVEWFAEWARDTRGEQRGLLLLTAHRAKGLEFDHVVILEGRWAHLSRGEEVNAPRRLFYVAMTRARRSLAVLTHGAHPFMHPTDDGVLWRQVAPQARDLLDGSLRYQVPDMQQVDLSYAGRLDSGHPALTAISAAKVGDSVTLRLLGNAWLLMDARGHLLGRMSRAFSPPTGLSFLRGEIGAIVRWRRSDNKEEYRDNIRRDEWEAVLPELVFGRLSA